MLTSSILSSSLITLTIRSDETHSSEAGLSGNWI